LSRIFLHNPPGKEKGLHVRPGAPEALKQEEQELLEGEPEVNQYVCIAVIVFSIGIMAPTAQWVSQSTIYVKSACSQYGAAGREH
jgi:Ca2+:H+ antiporter